MERLAGADEGKALKDKITLLSVGDGPEGIEIYTSQDEGVVDWATSFPAVYLTASINGAQVKLGPFTMPGIYRQLLDELKS